MGAEYDGDAVRYRLDLRLPDADGVVVGRGGLMNLATILVVLCLAAAAAAAIRIYRKQGTSDCCRGVCSSCKKCEKKR